MLAGIVPVSQAFALRVALTVQGIDVEFGEVATTVPYQRFDIFDADGQRVSKVLARFPRVETGKARRKVKLSNPAQLRRPQLRSSKETD